MGPTVLGIRDILVGSGSGVPYLWQIDPDRTLFFSDFKVAQKVYFLYIFSFNLPAGTLSSVLKFKFFAKIFGYNFILHELFQAQKQADPALDPDPQNWGPNTLPC